MSIEESKKLAKETGLHHIAFIMDGNGRWATLRGKSREEGHRKGADVFEQVTDYCFHAGIDTVTVYAFSTENWKRSPREISALMKLFSRYIEKAFDQIRKNDVRIVFLGDKSRFSPGMRKDMERLEKESAGGSHTLNLALNYGARAEITRAVNLLLAQGKKQVTEEEFSGYLYTADSPDPDLVVRTAGEKRLSNFLLWQVAYSEFYYTDTLWPDMNGEEIHKAICSFKQRERRFGNAQ